MKKLIEKLQHVDVSESQDLSVSDVFETVKGLFILDHENHVDANIRSCQYLSLKTTIVNQITFF